MCIRDSHKPNAMNGSDGHSSANASSSFCLRGALPTPFPTGAMALPPVAYSAAVDNPWMPTIPDSGIVAGCGTAYEKRKSPETEVAGRRL